METDAETRELLTQEIPEDTAEALQHFARLIDKSLDNKCVDGLRRALQLAEIINKRELNDAQASHFHYCWSNAFANLHLLEIAGKEGDWSWEQPYLEGQILHLRQAVAFLPKKTPKELGCPYHTNLANALNSIGRFVEAIEHWQLALKLEPTFGMALGNLGLGLFTYAYHLYDQGQASVLLKSAIDYLQKADRPEIHPSARQGFETRRTEIEKMFGDGQSDIKTDLDSSELGSSPDEIKYRKWCLKHRFFLNPLNDLGPYSIAARDIFTSPSIVVGINEGPYYPGFFNQMKQEFVSARFLLYEGTRSVEPHYSDARVLLYDTMDYPRYGLNIEKVRIAFRMSYSLLDKIAVFLNHYLDLGIKPSRVTFRTLWHERGRRKNGLRTFFEERRNLPLRGLFWLSKDLFEDRPGFREAMEPDAQELNQIRNHLEHKYLKLHESFWLGPDERQDMAGQGLVDTLAHFLRADAFEEKTLRMLKLARASLIYLSLGIHAEEHERITHQQARRLALEMPLFPLDDDWKR